MDKKTREKLPGLDEGAKAELRDIVEYIMCKLCNLIDGARQFGKYDKRVVLIAARKVLLQKINEDIARLKK